MKNIPKKIFLNVGDDPGDDFSELKEVTWCDTHQFDDDIEYINGRTHQRALLNAQTEGFKEGYLKRAKEENEYIERLIAAAKARVPQINLGSEKDMELYNSIHRLQGLIRNV